MSKASYRLLSPGGQVAESGDADVSAGGAAFVLAPASGAVLRVPFGQITSVTEPEPFTVRIGLADGHAVELARLGVIRTQLLAELHDGIADSAAAAAGVVGDAAVFTGESAGVRVELRVYDDALLIGGERIGFSFVGGVRVQDYAVTVDVAGREPVVLSRLGRQTGELAGLLDERLRAARGRTAAFLTSLLPGLDVMAVRSAAALLRDGVAGLARDLDAIHRDLTGTLLRVATLPARLDGITELARQAELAIGFKQVTSVRRPAAGVTPWHDHAATPHIGEHDSPGGAFRPGLGGMLAASVMAGGLPAGPGGFGFGEEYGACGTYWAFRALGAGLNGREQRPMTPRPDLTRGLLTPAIEDLAALTATGDRPTVLAFVLCAAPGRVIYEVLNLPEPMTYLYLADDPGALGSVNRALDDAGFQPERTLPPADRIPHGSGWASRIAGLLAPTGRLARMGDLILLRHGQTEWSLAGKHTGRTDIPLTARGETCATALTPQLESRPIAAILTSPAQRSVRTADLALGSAAAAAKQDPDLWEWDYGGYEGRTTEQIQQTRPGWYLWRDGVIPGDADHPGETVQSVGERTDRVLARVRPLLPDGDVVLVAHGHVLRILTARWLDLDPGSGRLFRLDTGTVSTLGFEHDEPVILTWNVPAP